MLPPLLGITRVNSTHSAFWRDPDEIHIRRLISNGCSIAHTPSSRSDFTYWHTVFGQSSSERCSIRMFSTDWFHRRLIAITVSTRSSLFFDQLVEDSEDWLFHKLCNSNGHTQTLYITSSHHQIWQKNTTISSHNITGHLTARPNFVTRSLLPSLYKNCY